MIARAPLRAIAALAAGGALWSAFPTLDLWWMAPVGVALLTAAVDGVRARWGFVLGLLAGWAFFVPSLSWAGIYVGALPWLALSTLQGLYVAATAATIAYAAPRLRRAGHPGWAAAVTPLAWVVGEWARSTTPWGGFPWVRLAFSQADGPLLGYAALGGAPLVTAAVATAGVGGLALVRALLRRRTRPGADSAPAWVVLAPAAALVVAVPLLGALVPRPTDGPAVPVGLVQGNVPKPGLDFNAERRKVLDNHVAGTEQLAATGRTLSLVAWPENSSDIDPLRNADAARQVQRALDAVGTPLLVGAILNEPVGHNSNVALLYRPGSTAAPERYTKNHPVPFAEYVPWKDFFRFFSPYVDSTAELVAGTELAAYQLSAPDGRPFAALPSICFEVAYDPLMRDIATQDGAGRSLLVVQTNNATFGFTAESEQQLAISRLRAVEHGRSVIHVSTVGVSGMIHPDGRVEGKTGLFTAAQVVADLPVRDAVTIADRLGGAPVRVAALGLLLLVVAARRTGSTDRLATTPPDPDEDPTVA